MKKYFINFLLCLSLIFYGSPILAVTQNEVNNQENVVQKTINEISELDKQINTLEQQILDLNQKIEQTSKDLLKAQEDVRKLIELKDNRIRVAYIYGTNGYFEYLFSGLKPADFISQYDITKDILSADLATLKELQKKQKEIETLQNNQIKQRDQLVKTKNQSETLRTEKNNTLNSNQALLNQLYNSLVNSTEQVEVIEEVPVATVTDNNSKQVATVSSVPLVNTAKAAGVNSEKIEDSNEIPENSTEFDQASAASISPRWLSTLEESTSQNKIEENDTDQKVESTQSQQSFQPMGEGLVSNTGTDNTNPYYLEIPNTQGTTTQIPKSQFPESLYWPLDASQPNSFIITSLIGSRESPGGIGSTQHGGIDIGASYGTAIVAATSGTIEVSGVYGGYGNAVMINHGNGLRTLYGHMSSIAVQSNQEVQAGQIIGFVGSTGWSTGPHLHFEVRYTDNAGNTFNLNGLSLYGQDILNRLSYNC